MDLKAATVAFHLGTRLRERREAMGLTQDQLAERLGTSVAEVRLFEEGYKTIPPRYLVQAAEALGPSLQWFLEGNPARSCEVPVSQASRDVMRFLAMPDAYPLISAFIAIADRDRRRSIIRHAQAAGQPDNSSAPNAAMRPERRARS